ncbi:MAG: hypothetical protein QRY74_04800 [Chlamydia sp.]
MNTPSFSAFFSAYYHSNTHLKPVDLEHNMLSHNKLEDLQKVAIQNFMSKEERQTAFSLSIPHRINFSGAIDKKEQTLSLKSACSLLYRENKQEKIRQLQESPIPEIRIESGAISISPDRSAPFVSNDRGDTLFLQKEDSLLRIAMAHRLAKVALDTKIELVIPERVPVRYIHLPTSESVNSQDKNPTGKCCIAYKEDLSILSQINTIRRIEAMSSEEQQKLARDISTIIQKAGMANASFEYIRLTTDGKLACINPLPAGLMIAKRDGLPDGLLQRNSVSVEKCARVGLYSLKEASNREKLAPFHKQIEDDYKKAVTPTISKWKIAFSILSLGILPLIQVIIALAKREITKKTAAEIEKIERECQLTLIQKASDLIKATSEDPTLSLKQLKELYETLVDAPFLNEYRAKRADLKERYYRSTKSL